MTVTVITTDTTAGVGMPDAGDNLIVSKTGSIIAPTSVIFGTEAQGQLITSAGFIDIGYIALGGGNIINFSDASVFNGHNFGASIIVGTSLFGAVITGSSVIANRGTFSADTDGISFFGANNTLTNTGSISVGGTAVITNNPGGGSLITNTGSIVAANGFGIELAASLDRIVNSGTIVSSNFSAIVLGSDNQVLQNSGQISGEITAVDLRGQSSTLFNDGTLLGSLGNAVSVEDGTNIFNGGKIDSVFAAIRFDFVGFGAVENHGVIVSTQGTGVDFSASTISAGNSLVNFGTVTGANFSYQGCVGQDTVINSGTMLGSVDLGVGDDIFDGRGGKVIGTVYGGDGQDTYYIDDATITLFESAKAGGIDSVYSSVSFRLAANFENLTLLDGANINATGNASANTLTGNSGDNRLTGIVGNDTLNGDLGNDRLYGGFGNDSLDGGDGDDTVAGNIGNDVLRGSDGDDLLNGGLGRDFLTGGFGADVFQFSGLAHSGPDQVSADVITDFTKGDDIIDLSRLDANANNAAPNDAFSFIGSAAFSNVAGQMHAIQVAGNTFIEMDVNGDGVADSVIRLNGLYTMNAGDFVL